MKNFKHLYLIFPLLFTLLVLPEAKAQNCENDISYYVNGLNVTFGDSSFGRNFNYWQWNFGDGNTSGDSTPTHNYAAKGSYNVMLISGDTSISCIDTSYVTVNLGCVVMPTYTANGLTAYFSDTSISGFTNRMWYFGDGDSSAQANPIHTYAQSGNYVATVYGYNSFTNCSDVIDFFVTVNQPTCDNQIFYTINGLSVSFSDSSSGRNINYWDWDFGDGSFSNQASPTHVYNTGGTYHVALYSGDTLTGCNDTAYAIVNVTGPTCTAIPNYTINGLTVNFSDSSSDNFTYWQWDFGDSNYSTQQNPIHTYFQSGNYSVMFYAYDSITNCADTVFFQVQVQQPTCDNLIFHTANGLTVNFSDSSQGRSFNFWRWDFGDGSVNNSNTNSPTHNYTSGGNYNVTLISGDTVTGCFDTTQISINLQSSNNYTLTGYVNLDTTVKADFARVWLIVYDSIAGTLTAIDSVEVDSGTYAGKFTFTNVVSGQYLIKAALLQSSSHYGNYMPTYYTDKLLWSNANLVSITGNRNNLDINMISGTPSSGPGFIGGYVSQGANKKAGIGDPLPNVQVLLLTTENVPVAYKYTDENGYFSFSNLALGTYKVHPEVYGKVTYPAIVTLTADKPNGDTVNMQVKEHTINTGIFSRPVVQSLNLYPNPVQDVVKIDLPAGNIGNYELTLTDLTGRNIWLKTGTAAGTAIIINVYDLPAGTYLLQMVTAEGAVYRQKLLKQ